MSKDVNTFLLKYPDYLRGSKFLDDSLNSAYWVKGWRDRRRIAKQPGVIESPAGMLKGGIVVFYMNHLMSKTSNAIFLVSYQVDNSPGRRLLETGKFLIKGQMRKVKAKVERFNFTSHCGRAELI